MASVTSKLKDTICNGLTNYYSINSVDECNSATLDSATLNSLSQKYILWFNKLGFRAVYSCSKGEVSDAIVSTSPSSFDGLLAADDACYNFALNNFRGSVMVSDNCVTGKTMQEVYDNCFTQLMTVF